MSKTITFQFGRHAVILDADDALKFVGVPLWVSSHGYVRVRAHDGRNEKYVHRIVMGAGKGEYVDHIDGNKLNNSKSNLRLCTNQENSCNARLRTNNKSGVKGVYWSNGRMKWEAQITSKGVRHALGRFNTFKEAVAARRYAEDALQGEFSALNGVMAESR